MSLVNATPIREASLRQLRHDLINPINVLMGTSSALLQTELNEFQRSCVQACQSTAQHLLEIVERLEEYLRDESRVADGRERLADLCSIAAARVDKPFDRDALLRTIERLAAGRAPRVLLVDDSPEIAVLVRAYLKGTGAEIDVVADGERALAQATSQRYDLVLMDIELPGMDGATAAHAIRTADLARGASPTPIVALSAFGAGLPPLEEGPGAGSDVPAGQSSDDVVTIDDPEIAPLVPEFLEQRRRDVDTVRALLEGGEFSRIQTLGHRMKGSGRGYGFRTISRIGGELELAAHQQDVRAVARLVDELAAYLDRVRIKR